VRLHKQPNSWSCLPTAFAMFFQRAPSCLINMPGHHGSEKPFHVDDIIPLALAMRVAVVRLEKVLEWTHLYPGVMLGNTRRSRMHAVAWDGRQVLDPHYKVYDLSKFYVREFYACISF
jgi:hypothetical protein